MGEIALNIGAGPAPRGGEFRDHAPQTTACAPQTIACASKRKLCLPKRERCPEEINRLRATEVQIEA